MAQLRKLQRCEKVAAVCYRIRSGSIEFLLVQTRSREHWIFPKGSAEPGLTHAQAAALEAFEEAGVHGRMEEASFTTYVHRKRGSARRVGGSPQEKPAVNAYLCEVLRLNAPQELNRNPTWFSAEKAKQRLRQDRPADFGGELARVIDRAVARIRRLHSEARPALEGQLAKPRLDGSKLEAPKTGVLQNVRFINDARTGGKPARIGRNIVGPRTRP